MLIEEGKAKIKVPNHTKISSRLPVFYNPVMKTNRDIAILLLNVLPMEKMHIGLPLAASGIRGIRFLKELELGKIASMSMNDHNPKFKKIISENFRLSKIRRKVTVSNEDANLFLLNSKGFDYIDIDPFGSPNPFLDSAIKRLSRRGILAVTSTDTAALASYKRVCLRKYWARPLLTTERHEAGIRILIRKVQLIGAQFDKALIPVFSYFKDHYYRIYFSVKKEKTGVDDIIRQHGMYKGAGPMWLGGLWDTKLAGKMYKASGDDFLRIIANESLIPAAGFFDLHRLHTIPRKSAVLQKMGRKASETHFLGHGIRSTVTEKELVPILRRV